MSSIQIIKTTTRTQKFNRDKYIKSVRELIVATYDIDKETANNAINRSGLIKSLNYSPEMTSHIPEEDWVEKIWIGYKKSLGN